MSITINFGKVGIYNEDFPSIKSPDPLITWSCKVVQVILADVSLPPQSLWPQNLAKWWLLRNFNPLSHTTLWTRGHAVSRDKLTTFDLQYYNTYGTKLGRVVTYNKELPSIKPLPFYHVVWLVVLNSLIRFVGLERKLLSLLNSVF